MAEMAQTAQGENPAFSCSVTGKPLTGGEILSTLPTSYRRPAGPVHRLRHGAPGAFLGYGSSEAGLLRYLPVAPLGLRHRLLHRRRVHVAERCDSGQGVGDLGRPVLDRGLGDPGRWSTGLHRARAGGRRAALERAPPDPPAQHRVRPHRRQRQYLLVEVTKRTHTDFSAVKSLVTQCRPAGGRNQDADGACRRATPFRHQRQSPVRRLGARARARSWSRWPRRHPTCPTPRPTSRPRRRRRHHRRLPSASPFSG